MSNKIAWSEDIWFEFNRWHAPLFITLWPVLSQGATRQNSAVKTVVATVSTSLLLQWVAINFTSIYSTLDEMGCCGGKRGQKFKDNGTLKEKLPFSVRTPTSRGIGYIPKERKSSRMCNTAAAMPSSGCCVKRWSYRIIERKSQMYCTFL